MIEYRRARPGDAKAIGELHAQSFRENNPSLVLEEDSSAELLDLWTGRLDRPRENQLLQVALDATGLQGFACAYGADDPQWGSLIDNMHVAASARRNGVGSALMAAAASWLAERYADLAVHLFVLESNHGARRFYERQGGREVETLEMPAHGGATVPNRRYEWPTPRHIGAG